MSRLEVPIFGRILHATGDVKLWADVKLEVKDAVGRWHRRIFRLDSGSELTTFPALDAKQLGLAMPQNVSPGVIHTQSGQPVHSGILRFRIVGLDATEYAVACMFLGPTTAAQAQSTFAPRLLQPFQLLGRLRFRMEKEPALGNPYGEVVIEQV